MMPHLSMSQVYQESGWEEVAQSIAFSETEFCYLQPDSTDQYKFALQNDSQGAQMGSILKNDYVTMSKHGIMRSSVVTGQSELITYDNMLVEQRIYHKLIRIKVFSQFRLWKTFYVWKKTIKLNKFKNRVSVTLRWVLLYSYISHYTIISCIFLLN